MKDSSPWYMSSGVRSSYTPRGACCVAALAISTRACISGSTTGDSGLAMGDGGLIAWISAAVGSGESACINARAASRSAEACLLSSLSASIASSWTSMSDLAAARLLDGGFLAIVFRSLFIRAAVCVRGAWWGCIGARQNLHFAESKP